MAVVRRREVIEAMDNDPSLQKIRFDAMVSVTTHYLLSRIVLNTFSYSSA